MSRSATITATAAAPTIISDTPVAPASASSSSSSSSPSAASSSPAADSLRISTFPYWYSNPDTLRLQQWVLPGTGVAAVSGLVVGGSIGAVLNRPLLASAKNVSLKFAIPSFLYLTSVSMWTRRAPPEWSTARLPVHMGAGAALGTLLGSITGRGRGALGGAVLGAALAMPAYYVLEGRHEGSRKRQAEEQRAEEDRRIAEYQKNKQAGQQQQQ